MALVEKALSSPPGPYTLQAAIAAVPAQAESTAVTDWRHIVALYNRSVRIQPSPVVLNRVGTWRIGKLLPGAFTRAGMYRSLGRTADAPASYEKALALTKQEPERQFLQERIRQLKKNRVAVDFRSSRTTI